MKLLYCRTDIELILLASLRLDCCAIPLAHVRFPHPQYYRDYEDLERHFRTEHYLCEEVSVSPPSPIAPPVYIHQRQPRVARRTYEWFWYSEGRYSYPFPLRDEDTIVLCRTVVVVGGTSDAGLNAFRSLYSYSTFFARGLWKNKARSCRVLHEYCNAAVRSSLCLTYRLVMQFKSEPTCLACEWFLQ